MGGLLALDYAIRSPARAGGGDCLGPPADTAQRCAVAQLCGQRLVQDQAGFQHGYRRQAGNHLARSGRGKTLPRRSRMSTAAPLPAWAPSCRAAQTWVQAHAGDLQIPLLLYHGTDDPLVPIAGSRTFFANVKAGDKEWIEWPGGYHESHNDLQRADVFTAVVNWLDRHTLVLEKRRQEYTCRRQTAGRLRINRGDRQSADPAAAGAADQASGSGRRFPG